VGGGHRTRVGLRLRQVEGFGDVRLTGVHGHSDKEVGGMTMWNACAPNGAPGIKRCFCFSAINS